MYVPYIMYLDICICLNKVTFDISILENYLLTITDGSAQGCLKVALKIFFSTLFCRPCRNIIYNIGEYSSCTVIPFSVVTSPYLQEHIESNHLLFMKELTYLLIESNSQEFTVTDDFSVMSCPERI